MEAGELGQARSYGLRANGRPSRRRSFELTRKDVDDYLERTKVTPGGGSAICTRRQACGCSSRPAIETEVTEFLGRERYAHGERARVGSRNGHCPTTIKTTAGPITIERPKLRGTDEAFASRLLGVGVCRTNALEPLVIAGFVRGLSVRDVEATLADAPRRRGHIVEVDGVAGLRGDQDRVRPLAQARPTSTWTAPTSGTTTAPGPSRVLAAWGMTTEGRPVLVGLEPGSSESTDAWSGFLDGMVARGLRAPLLVISDGAPGLIAAVELVFPHSLRQRCLIHRARNILAKVPAEHQGEVKSAFWGIFDGIEAPSGDAAVAVAAIGPRPSSTVTGLCSPPPPTASWPTSPA